MKSNRRSFLKGISALSGGLILGFSWNNEEAFAATSILQTADTTKFNAFLAINTDGTISITSPNPEIGQGIKTAFPIIVAEELDADWSKVNVLQADLSAAFDRQLTGGSGAIKHSWQRLREAGATTREMLKTAAAQKWNIDSTQCSTEKGFVINNNTGAKLSYGDLAQAAAKITPPKEVKLKNVNTFSLIGSSVKGVDNPAVLTGKPLYGIDLQKDGMYLAQLIRPEAFGTKLKSFDASEALKMPGIVEIKAVGNKIAIIGHKTWEIMQARKKITVVWEKDQTLESSTDHDQLFKNYLNDTSKAEVRRKDGDVDSAFKQAFKIIEAEYQCPFLPHSPMEPMNFYADVQADKVIMAGPTQTPARARASAAKITGIAEENISVELTKMGGGFGRRLDDGYAIEAVEVSKAVQKPIKLIWTREDDLTGGYYRPAVRYRFKAAIDNKGTITAYYLKGVGINSGNPVRQDNFPAGAVENLLIESYDHKSPITTGPWRAPITNFLAYAEQAFLDEVAKTAGKDPVQMRLELIEKAIKNPVGKLTYEPERFKVVMQTAMEKAAWGKKKGVYQGFSVYFSHNSYVAQIAEMVKKKGKPELKKVYAVTDCGIVINQSGARNQIYGAIIDGLGHAMYGKLSFKDGRPEQRNFDTYRLIKMTEVPEIEAHFIDNGIDPTGLGEPALPPLGGAVANAIAAATGKRLYSQPFNLEDDKVESYL